MLERRRYPRYPTQELHGQFEGFRHRRVLNLSEGGMLLLLPLETIPGKIGAATLELPGSTFRCLGRVVYVGPDTEVWGEYRVGIAFGPLSEESLTNLQRFIRQELAATIGSGEPST